MKKILISLLIICILIMAIFIFIKYNLNNISDQNDENQNVLEEENTNVILNETEVNTETLGEGSENVDTQSEDIKINIIVNDKTFSATLYNNETVEQLIQMFPITLNMSDLNSNEKYFYLDNTLTTDSSIPNIINAGDIKLYGNNCLVIFYETFSTSYSYTDLGQVDNVDEFVSELGSGSVSISFEIAD